MTITFTIPGDVIPQGRPRFATKGRGGRPLPFVKTYDPPKSTEYKKKVAMLAKIAMRGRSPMAGAVSVDLRLFRKCPVGMKKADRERAIKGQLCPIIGFDVDNSAKGIMDGMAGIVFGNDKQVVILHVEKHYAAEPRAVVTAEEIQSQS